MTSAEVLKIVEADLKAFKYAAPELGSTVGVPWTEDKVMTYIPKLKAALVKPYLQSFLLKETYEQINDNKKEHASYWVIAEESGNYYQWYDPDNNEYGLAQKSESRNDFISIGVRGDLVGVYCAM